MSLAANRRADLLGPLFARLDRSSVVNIILSIAVQTASYLVTAETAVEIHVLPDKMGVYVSNCFLQLSEWFEELRTELLDGKLAENVEGAAQLLRQFHRQKEATIEAAVNTINEGESLLEQLG